MDKSGKEKVTVEVKDTGENMLLHTWIPHTDDVLTGNSFYVDVSFLTFVAPVVIPVVVGNHISCLHIPWIKLGSASTHLDLQVIIIICQLEEPKVYFL
mgnify:CR=1 FL=1